MAFKCPKCDEEFFDRLKYCPSCGYDFSAGQKKCPKCREIVPKDDKVCPVCGLDFEQWSFLVPKIIVFGGAAIIVIALILFPLFWKSTSWLHKKGTITEGMLRSESHLQSEIPMFIHYRTGEEYIEQAESRSENVGNSDYMNQLIPLPPEVIFHWDIPVGEDVYIIERERGESSLWFRIGRDVEGHDRYGWVHESNIRLED